MLLLTWHGTILRVEQSQRRLTHAPLVPERAVAIDFGVEMVDGQRMPAMLAGGMEIVAGPQPRIVFLRRGAAHLSVDAALPFPAFGADIAAEAETLLALEVLEVAALRALLSGAWQRGDTGAVIGPETMRLAAGFRLLMDDLTLDLAEHRLALNDDGCLAVQLRDGTLILSPAAPATAAAEISLRPATPAPSPPTVKTAIDLEAVPSVWVRAGTPERVFLPMAARRADQDWFYRAALPARPTVCGLKVYESRVVHEADSFLVLAQAAAGLVFDIDGEVPDDTLLRALPPGLPAPLAREGDHVFVSEAALRSAPPLPGAYAIAHSPAAPGTANGWLDTVARMSVLEPALPPGVALLLPQGSTPEDGAILQLCGWDGMKLAVADAPVCRIQHLYRADRCDIEHVPAAFLEAVRTRARARLPPGEPHRIYIRPSNLTGAPIVEAILAEAGFTAVTITDMTSPARAALFARANFVIGVHGPALANLLFCAPGTKVLELAPACAYRQAFALLSSKLGLLHGVLPCATHDGTISGTFSIDRDRLRALLRMLLSRL